MLTAQNRDDKLKEIKPYLKEKFQVGEIGYFGSFAENMHTEESYIDILVSFSRTPGWEFLLWKNIWKVPLTVRLI